jgi:hypothetical protein
MRGVGERTRASAVLRHPAQHDCLAQCRHASLQGHRSVSTRSCGPRLHRRCARTGMRRHGLATASQPCPPSDWTARSYPVSRQEQYRAVDAFDRNRRSFHELVLVQRATVHIGQRLAGGRRCIGHERKRLPLERPRRSSRQLISRTIRCYRTWQTLPHDRAWCKCDDGSNSR